MPGLMRLSLVCVLWAAATTAFAGTPGIFEGRVYQDAGGSKDWIYVQGRNGRLRRVEISRARVIYADTVPLAERDADASADLSTGAEVRVTAEQDGAGEWRATRIEILRVPRRRREQMSGLRVATAIVRTRTWDG